MRRDDLLITAGETIAYAEDFLDTKIELVKLSIAETGSKTAADLIAGIVVATCGLFALAALSISLAILLGSLLDSFALGFLIVGILYLIIAALMFAFRKSLLVNPILRALLTSLFNPSNNVK